MKSLKKLLPNLDDKWTLFLDRDGTINVRSDHYIEYWQQFSFLPGVLEALPYFNVLFNKVLIVTNQQGIGKEIMTHQQLEDIHKMMMEEIWNVGGKIDQIYYCSELAIMDPVCRKPNPGMALQAQKDFPNIKFRKSIMIGDTESDVAFGNNLGMFTICVGRNKETKANLHLDSLEDFLYLLKKEKLI